MSYKACVVYLDGKNFIFRNGIFVWIPKNIVLLLKKDYYVDPNSTHLLFVITGAL